MKHWLTLGESKKGSIHNVQHRILRQLMHKPQLSFNQLWNKEGTSNRFAYHLKMLEEQGLIRKNNDAYSLTSLGKKKVVYLEGETGEETTAPVIAVITIVFDKQKILVLERSKEPFYGYFGFGGGKLRRDEYILECAGRSLKEETGLSCNLKLKGLFSSKTYEGDTLLYNHQLFVVKATVPTGELLASTRKGKNVWMSKTQLRAVNVLPSAFTLLEIAGSSHFRWIEADRKQSENVVEMMKILRDETL